MTRACDYSVTITSVDNTTITRYAIYSNVTVIRKVAYRQMPSTKPQIATAKFKTVETYNPY